MNTNRADLNLDFYRGDTAWNEFGLLDKDGNPFNLTGFVVRCQARQVEDSDETIFDLTLVDGENGNSFVNGVVNLFVPASITRDMPPVCRYDIQATSGTLVFTLVRGSINTLADVTR